jgi:hypothetical protein
MPAEPTGVSGQLMGCLMKNGIATYSVVSDEYYVLQINGRVNSTHRRYEDAIRAGLLLKYQFPHDDIKVRVTNSNEEVMQGTVLH